jgi:hypothetical protein
LTGIRLPRLLLARRVEEPSDRPRHPWSLVRKAEIQVVQNICELFVEHGKTEREISEVFNGRGVLGMYERPSTRSAVYQVLTNAKYRGGSIYNRRSLKLKRKQINNPVEMWIL